MTGTGFLASAQDTPLTVAARRLTDGLTAFQLRPVLLSRRHPGDIYTVQLSDFVTYTVAGTRITGRFTDTHARALEHALAGHAVAAEVTAERGARLALRTVRDVAGLADLVWKDLPDDCRAAHQLRTAFHAAGRALRTSPDGIHPHVADGAITIGEIDVPQALLLLELLDGTPPRPTRGRCDCRYLQAIADALRGRLRTTTPRITVTAQPSCTSDSSEHIIAVGPAPVEHIQSLTTRITTHPAQAHAAPETA
ncbi:hypothetical protein [Streptomyces albipurpureus]|uniref:Uncharacterized protein n=1 Tax=Streptomyces albipurpureus TaxID=2897419 RepID=A0ABT0UZZ1_9ACTN|nr:hypothetical protein [Streptomyces sp. CWNU-1]MCM2392726.1 hypothetical protein [Streptomyces sp. CWNU-1]